MSWGTDLCHAKNFSQEDLEVMSSGILLGGPDGDQVQKLLDFFRWESNRHGNIVEQESKPDYGGGRRSAFVGSLFKAQAEMVDSCRISVGYQSHQCSLKWTSLV